METRKTYIMPACVAGFPYSLKGFLTTGNSKLDSVLTTLYNSTRKWEFLKEVSSVTLFALKINLLVKAISPGVEASLYVDDFSICYRSEYVNIMERHIQRCLSILSI